MLEKNLQQKVIQYCKQRAIICVKVDSTSTRGWPDLTVILQNGQVLFVELKTPAGKLSPVQEYVHNLITGNKGKVYVVRSLQEFEQAIESAKATA